MSRTRPRFTQADVERAIRAAKQTGAGDVEIRPDGTIRVKLSTEATEPAVDESAIVVM